MAAGFVKSCFFAHVKEIDWDALVEGMCYQPTRSAIPQAQRMGISRISSGKFCLPCFTLCRATASSLQTSVAHSQAFLSPAMSLLTQEVYSKFPFDF